MSDEPITIPMGQAVRTWMQSSVGSISGATHEAVITQARDLFDPTADLAEFETVVRSCGYVVERRRKFSGHQSHRTPEFNFVLALP